MNTLSAREGFFRMALQKLCESCGKIVSFSGFVQAMALHADGRFACPSCRKKEKTRPATAVRPA